VDRIIEQDCGKPQFTGGQRRIQALFDYFLHAWLPGLDSAAECQNDCGVHWRCQADDAQRLEPVWWRIARQCKEPWDFQDFALRVYTLPRIADWQKEIRSHRLVIAHLRLQWHRPWRHQRPITHDDRRLRWNSIQSHGNSSCQNQLRRACHGWERRKVYPDFRRHLHMPANVDWQVLLRCDQKLHCAASRHPVWLQGVDY